PPVPRSARKRSRRPRWPVWAGAGAAAVLAIGLLAWAAWPTKKTPPPPVTPPETPAPPPGTPAAAPAPADAGWVPLFNGRDLTGWKRLPGQPGDWGVEDGVLVGRGPAVSHLFSERGGYTDVHVRAEARINHAGNAT